MILKKVEGRRNPRAWHGSRLTVSGLHGHPSTPNPRPKRRVETPGDPWCVPQPPGPSSPAYGMPPTANRWFLPLSSSEWGQTLPTTSVMFPVRIEPQGHAQGGVKIQGARELNSEKLVWTPEHVPISVSICSNVDGFQTPYCIVDPNTNELVAQMVQYMTTISDKSYELTKTKFAEAFEMLDRVIRSEVPFTQDFDDNDTSVEELLSDSNEWQKQEEPLA